MYLYLPLFIQKIECAGIENICNLAFGNIAQKKQLISSKFFK